MVSSAPSAPGSATDAGPSYADHPQWLRYQAFFPGALRLSERTAPREEWWSWRGMTVHLDRVTHPDAPAKLIALHGAGGYGRLLAPYSRLPSMAGMEFLAPDLPGFGLTRAGYRTITYRAWTDCVLALIRAERRADPRPIVLLGVGTGGRLAYDVAALATRSVDGVVATCLADPQRDAVRRRLAVRPELGPWASVLGLVPAPLRPLRVPVRWLANVAAIANHAQFAGLLWTDPLGAGSRIPLSLVRTHMSSAPTVEPEDYAGPPLLLAHPADDRWLPEALSRPFFDRIASVTRFASLSGAGHLPVEEAGLADLDRAVRDFLDELGLG